MHPVQYASGAYADRYGGEHPLFYLHTLEMLLNLGYQEDARNIAEMLVSGWPECIPGHVYRWQLEPDPETRDRLYRQLKETYPTHWIVAQI